MSRDQAPEPCLEATRRGFAETHWSVVLAARDGCDAPARSASDTLCRLYWYPVYALVRGRGYSPQDTEDLTQGFFHRLIAKSGLRQVQPSKGRFRHFLLAALKNFLSNEWDRARTLKGCKAERHFLFYLIERVCRHPSYSILRRLWYAADGEHARGVVSPVPAL